MNGLEGTGDRGEEISAIDAVIGNIPEQTIDALRSTIDDTRTRAYRALLTRAPEDYVSATRFLDKELPARLIETKDILVTVGYLIEHYRDTERVEAGVLLDTVAIAVQELGDYHHRGDIVTYEEFRSALLLLEKTLSEAEAQHAEIPLVRVKILAEFSRIEREESYDERIEELLSSGAYAYPDDLDITFALARHLWKTEGGRPRALALLEERFVRTGDIECLIEKLNYLGDLGSDALDREYARYLQVSQDAGSQPRTSGEDDQQKEQYHLPLFYFRGTIEDIDELELLVALLETTSMEGYVEDPRITKIARQASQFIEKQYQTLDERLTYLLSLMLGSQIADFSRGEPEDGSISVLQQDTARTLSRLRDDATGEYLSSVQMMIRLVQIDLFGLRDPRYLHDYLTLLEVITKDPDTHYAQAAYAVLAQYPPIMVLDTDEDEGSAAGVPGVDRSLSDEDDEDDGDERTVGEVLASTVTENDKLDEKRARLIMENARAIGERFDDWRFDHYLARIQSLTQGMYERYHFGKDVAAHMDPLQGVAESYQVFHGLHPIAQEDYHRYIEQFDLEHGRHYRDIVTEFALKNSSLKEIPQGIRSHRDTYVLYLMESMLATPQWCGEEEFYDLITANGVDLMSADTLSLLFEVAYSTNVIFDPIQLAELSLPILSESPGLVHIIWSLLGEARYDDPEKVREWYDQITEMIISEYEVESIDVFITHIESEYTSMREYRELFCIVRGIDAWLNAEDDMARERFTIAKSLATEIYKMTYPDASEGDLGQLSSDPWLWGSRHLNSIDAPVAEVTQLLEEGFFHTQSQRIFGELMNYYFALEQYEAITRLLPVARTAGIDTSLYAASLSILLGDITGASLGFRYHFQHHESMRGLSPRVIESIPRIYEASLPSQAFSGDPYTGSTLSYLHHWIYLALIMHDCASVDFGKIFQLLESYRSTILIEFEMIMTDSDSDRGESMMEYLESTRLRGFDDQASSEILSQAVSDHLRDLLTIAADFFDRLHEGVAADPSRSALASKIEATSGAYIDRVARDIRSFFQGSGTLSVKGIQEWDALIAPTSPTRSDSSASVFRLLGNDTLH